MNTLFVKKIISLSIIFCYSIPSYAWINLSEFDKVFHQMEQSFKRMRKDIHDDVKSEFKSLNGSSWKVAYHDSSAENSLKVVVSDIDTHTIDAQINDDPCRLSIIVDNGTIIIKVLKNWISLCLEQRIEHTESTNKSSKSHTSLSTVSSSQTVAHTIDLVGAEIEYKASEKTLTITIPYQKVGQSNKKIPVKMQ